VKRGGGGRDKRSLKVSDGGGGFKEPGGGVGGGGLRVARQGVVPGGRENLKEGGAELNSKKEFLHDLKQSKGLRGQSRRAQGQFTKRA